MSRESLIEKLIEQFPRGTFTSVNQLQVKRTGSNQIDTFYTFIRNCHLFV